MKIEHLIRDANKFAHIFKLDGDILVVDDMCDLTAFCSPMLRRGSGQTRIQYELGLLVLPAVADLDRAFTDSIIERRYVCLPKTIGIDNFWETWVENNQISDWILSDMQCVMKKYTLSKDSALTLIETGEDCFVESLRRVYGEQFEDWILNPLTNMT